MVGACPCKQLLHQRGGAGQEPSCWAVGLAVGWLGVQCRPHSPLASPTSRHLVMRAVCSAICCMHRMGAGMGRLYCLLLPLLLV